MNTQKNKEKWVEKIRQTLEIGGRSEKTLANYKSHLIRFLNYYDNDTNLKKLNETDVLTYIRVNYIDKGLSGESYNMAVKSIRFFYSICFDKVDLYLQSLEDYMNSNVKNVDVQILFIHLTMMLIGCVIINLVY